MSEISTVQQKSRIITTTTTIVSPATSDQDKTQNSVDAGNTKSVSYPYEKQQSQTHACHDSTILQDTKLFTSKLLDEELCKYSTMQDLRDEYVLCVIAVDELKLSDLNYNHKINQVAREILKFCQNNSNTLTGYKCNKNKTGKDTSNSDDLFGVLVNCGDGKFKRSEMYVKLLMKQVKNATNENIRVGIAKMNLWETWDKWKLRAFDNLEKVLDGYYSDIDHDVIIHVGKGFADINIDQAVNELNLTCNCSVRVSMFIRLFMIRRIIYRYICCNYNVSNAHDGSIPIHSSKNQKLCPTFVLQVIEDLVHVFDDNVTIKAFASVILTHLINYGIKVYMDRFYNEKQQSSMIELIFNKIILKKFTKKYTDLITYNDPDNNYQKLVFNSDDLMCEIFKYLEYAVELFLCNFVNSYWLYQSFNVQSVFFIDLSKLIKATIEHGSDQNQENPITRMWQRLVYAKSISLDVKKDMIEKMESENIRNSVVNKLSLLKNFDSIYARLKIVSTLSYVHKSIFETIILRWNRKIINCDVRLSVSKSNDSNGSNSDHEHDIPPLVLPNARYIKIGDNNFHRIWSDKCKKLVLSRMINVGHDWCEFVLKHCDFSGINKLTLSNSIFSWIRNSNSHASKDKYISTLKQLASKLINLKRLKIFDTADLYITASNPFIFWRLMRPIILKNDVKLEYINENIKKTNLHHFNREMQKNSIKIEKLIIKMRDAKYTGKPVGDMTTLRDVNDFLTLILKKIIEKQFTLLVCGTFYVNWQPVDRDAVLDGFKKCCQNICKLFSLPIFFDITVAMRYYHNCNQYEMVVKELVMAYKSYFENKEFVGNYNKPECDSNVYVPCRKPYTCVRRQQYFVFRSTNIESKFNMFFK